MNEDNKPPNFIKKAENFTKASMRHAASGFEHVSENVKQHRMRLCAGCDFLMPPEDNPTCGQCGCYLNIKIGWASESCPVGKWSRINKSESGKCNTCGNKKT